MHGKAAVYTGVHGGGGRGLCWGVVEVLRVGQWGGT